MITNNLLSEVLDLPNVTGYKIQDNVAYIKYSENDEVWSFGINIYELAHKCKEWAFQKHKVYLMSTLYSRNHWVCSAQGDDPFEEADTEPEAIFAACQWILDNKDK